VLIVDDESSVRQVAGEMLARLGLKPLVATNGEEGLKVLRERAADIDLVLLDLNMPVMDGEECLRKMRDEALDARVVLCSGYDEQSIEPRFENLGLAAFLKKPYMFAQFRDAVTTAMAR
jgi:CheY-like chemotaxis protein